MELKEPPIPPDQEAQSADLVRIVGVFYALVLGQTIITNHSVLLDPSRGDCGVAAVALLATFTAAAWQYLRLSLNIVRTPYDVRWESSIKPQTASEELRFGIDLLIAALFAVLLVEALDLYYHPLHSLWAFLFTILAINILDLISFSLVRHHWNVEYEPKGWSFLAKWSHWWPLLVLPFYVLLFHKWHNAWVNLLTLGIVLVAANVREIVERRAAKDRWAKHITAKNPKPAATDYGERGSVYLAGPLGFSEATTDFHRRIVNAATNQGWKVLDPWKVDCLQHYVLNQKPGAALRKRRLLGVDRELGKQNVALIDQASAVLAVLDGSDVDSGTASEIGYTAAMKKPVVGLRLDTRMSGDNEAVVVNLQVEHFLCNKDKIARTLE